MILTRYLSATVLKHFVLFSLVVLILASLIQFLENRDGLLDGRDLDVQDVITFSLLSAPGMFSLLAGFIAAVSVIVACIVLLRNSELKAMLAAGLSFAQLIAALAPAALAMASFHFWIENSILPFSVAELRHRSIVGKADDLAGAPNAIWVHQGSYILVVGRLREASRTLEQVAVIKLNNSGHVVEYIGGQTARFLGGDLRLRGVVRTVSADLMTTVESEFTFATSLDFDTLASLALHPRHTSVWRIARVLDQSSAAAHPRHVYAFWLHKKVSAPIATALIVFLLAALVQRVHRIDNNARLLLLGLAAGFLFFVVDAILAGMGEAGLLPPAVAAWMLPIILLLVVLSPLLSLGGGGRSLVTGRASAV